ncbi:MAG: flavodoxin family protein [Candidatus Shapirobacteria bacterium]
MNILIIFDSIHGNTQKIGNYLFQTLSEKNSTQMYPISQIQPSDILGYDLLIVGSPTHGGQATPALQHFLSQLPPNSLKGVKLATFDTRFDFNLQKPFLRLLMKLIGYASPKIAASLQNKGAQLVTPPIGFIVTGTNGPLAKNQLEKAKSWAQQIIEQAS